MCKSIFSKTVGILPYVDYVAYILLSYCADMQSQKLFVILSLVPSYRVRNTAQRRVDQAQQIEQGYGTNGASLPKAEPPGATRYLKNKVLEKFSCSAFLTKKV